MLLYFFCSQFALLVFTLLIHRSSRRLRSRPRRLIVATRCIVFYNVHGICGYMDIGIDARENGARATAAGRPSTRQSERGTQDRARRMRKTLPAHAWRLQGRKRSPPPPVSPDSSRAYRISVRVASATAPVSRARAQSRHDKGPSLQGRPRAYAI